MDNKLGTIISKLRKKKGLTQKELADKLNISDKAVSRWETGSSSPNMDMLLRISKFFQVPLNDLITARVSSDEEDDDIVQEIIKEFSEMNKKNSKRIKTVLIITLIIILILTIAIIFTHTFNRFKVYKVNIENENFSSITGVYIETNIKDSLYLENIKIRDYTLKDSDIVSVDLYFKKKNKEYIIQNYSSLDNIYFVNYQSYIKLDDLSDYINDLYLRVNIIDSDGNKKEYTGKINFVLDFSNNKIFYNEDETTITKRSTTITVNEIKIILLDNGFEEITNNILKKKTKNMSINYLLDVNRVNINFESNNLIYRYSYFLNNEILEVSVFDENTTKIENYKYDVANKKRLECSVGSCNDYEYAVSVLAENFLKLLK